MTPPPQRPNYQTRLSGEEPSLWFGLHGNVEERLAYRQIIQRKGRRNVSELLRPASMMYEDPEWVEYLCDRIQLKRPGDPRNLEGAVVLLASDASAYMTDQTLLVDGGISTGATRALPRKK